MSRSRSVQTVAEDVERRVAGGLRTKQGLHMAGTDGSQQRVPAAMAGTALLAVQTA